LVDNSIPRSLLRNVPLLRHHSPPPGGIPPLRLLGPPIFSFGLARILTFCGLPPLSEDKEAIFLAPRFSPPLERIVSYQPKLTALFPFHIGASSSHVISLSEIDASRPKFRHLPSSKLVGPLRRVIFCPSAATFFPKMLRASFSTRFFSPNDQGLGDALRRSTGPLPPSPGQTPFKEMNI